MAHIIDDDKWYELKESIRTNSKAYVLTIDTNYGLQNIGVFSSQDKAIEAGQKYINEYSVEIEEYILDGH